MELNSGSYYFPSRVGSRILLFYVRDFIPNGIICYWVTEGRVAWTKGKACSCGLCGSRLDQEKWRPGSGYDRFLVPWVASRKEKKSCGSRKWRRNGFWELFMCSLGKTHFSKARMCSLSKICSLGQVVFSFRNSLLRVILRLFCWRYVLEWSKDLIEESKLVHLKSPTKEAPWALVVHVHQKPNSSQYLSDKKVKSIQLFFLQKIY